MIIHISIQVAGDHATLDTLNYITVEPTSKAFAQIADITEKTIDAYTAAIEGIIAANQALIKQPENTIAPEPAPAPEPEPVKEEKPVTLEEVRKALIEVKKTKPEGLKICFDAVGTKSLSATDPSLYGALLAKAQEVLHA